MKNFIQILCAVVLACTVFLTGCSPQTGDSSTGDNVGASARAEAVGQLTVKVLNIGQGDAILIQTGEQNVLIDTGDDKFYEDGKKGTSNNMLFDELSKAHVTQIDKLIMTHAHADHIGKAADVIKQYNVKELIYNGIPSTSKYFTNALKAAKAQGTQQVKVKAGDVLDFGNGASYEVLSPTKAEIDKDTEAIKAGGKPEANDESIVGKLTFGDFSMLLTGDAKKEIETELVKKYGTQLRCQILKAGHHGSKTSSSTKLLNAVQPEAVVISAGVNNRYEHPHDVTLKKYKEQGIGQIFCTKDVGTITITTDGSSYKITTEQ